MWSTVYSPDGRFIVTASFDGTARQYVMDIDELLRLAQSRVTRQLTPAERAQFGLE